MKCLGVYEYLRVQILHILSSCLTQHTILFLPCTQTCCVDLSPLGAARPRDVSSSPPNVAAVKSPEMLEV